MEIPQGPNPENLKHVAGMFPSMMKGLKEGSTRGKGRRIFPSVTQPTKRCKICGKELDIASLSPVSSRIPTLCQQCDGLLKEGYTALVAGDMHANMYAFVKLNTDKELAGQIVPISPQNMEKVQKEFQANWQTKDDDTATAT